MSDNFYQRISSAQCALKAPKNQYNSFGKYSYRSCEDILEAAKPVCSKYQMTLTLSDSVLQIGDRYYTQATATLIDWESGARESVTASAREAETKKGMDDSQITGTASSYARKYALNGLFNIDDTKDADTDVYTANTSGKTYVCADCGMPFAPVTDKSGKTWTPQQLFEASKRKNADGKARCAVCRKRAEGQQ